MLLWNLYFFIFIWRWNTCIFCFWNTGDIVFEEKLLQTTKFSLNGSSSVWGCLSIQLFSLGFDYSSIIHKMSLSDLIIHQSIIKWAYHIKLFYRASSIQSRVSELRTLLFGEVIQKLISKTYVEESSTLTKKKEIVTEIRLIETNPAFKHVQECLNWIETRQVCLIIP